MKEETKDLILPLEAFHQPWHIVFLDEKEQENKEQKKN